MPGKECVSDEESDERSSRPVRPLPEGRERRGMWTGTKRPLVHEVSAPRASNASLRRRTNGSSAPCLNRGSVGGPCWLEAVVEPSEIRRAVFRVAPPLTLQAAKAMRPIAGAGCLGTSSSYRRDPCKPYARRDWYLFTVFLRFEVPSRRDVFDFARPSQEDRTPVFLSIVDLNAVLRSTLRPLRSPKPQESC